MSMDLYHMSMDGTEGFLDKSSRVCTVKGTRRPERIDKIVEASKAVHALFAKQREDAVMAAVMAGDAKAAERAITEYVTWDKSNPHIADIADNAASYAFMDQWDAVVIPNHDAIVHEFNQHAATLGKVAKAGRLFYGNDSAELVRRIEEGGPEQFTATVEQRDACANLTRLARLMILNMSLGNHLPVAAPNGINSAEGRSFMMWAACFDPKQLEANSEQFMTSWKRHTRDGDIQDAAWVDLALQGFIPHARTWEQICKDAQSNSDTR